MTLFIDGLLNGTDGTRLPFALDMILKVAALLLVATAATKVLKNASASLRHRVWTIAFATVLALPLLAGSLPSWRVAIPAWKAPTQTRLASIVANDAVQSLREGPVSSDTDPATATFRGSESSLPAAAGSPERALRDPFGWGSLWMVLLLTWLAGTLVLLARLGVGVLSAWWTSRKGVPLRDPAWLSAIVEAQSRLGIEDTVRVVSSPWVGSPMTWGLLRPILLLPEDTGDWSSDRRRAIALHELAHVKRRDCLVHVLAQATRALHWMNPLAWIGAKRMQAERERACDDMVLMAGASNTDYAELLLDMARGRGDRHLTWAAVSMARPSELEGRLLAILDPARNRRGVGRLGSLGALVAIALVAMPLAALQATPGPGPDVFDGPLLDSATPVASPRSATKPGRVVAGTDAELPGVPETVETRLEVRSETRRATQRESLQNAEEVTALPEGTASMLARPQTPDTLEAHYVEVIAQALQHQQADFRAEAARTLGNMESSLAVPALSEAAGDTSADVRRQVAWALGMIESPDAVPTLTILVRDGDQDVREEAAWALGMIESPDGLEPLLSLLQDASEDLRKEAAWALGMIESPGAVDGLVEVLRSDTSARVRREAAWALGMIEDPSAAEVLADAINDEDEDVAREAMSSLARVLGS